MKKGFTLVELIIAMTIFTLLVGGIFFALGGGLRAWRKIAGETERRQIAHLVMERICRDVRAASAVMSASCTSEVALQVDSEVIRYGLENGKVKKEKGKSAAFLTNAGEIGELAFSYPAKGRVKIALEGMNCCVSNRN